MLHVLLQEVQKDCITHGYGRKRWWAKRLGVPPLTLSHWLAKRQHPSGAHALKIRETLDWLEQNDMATRWKDYLWDSYYTGWRVPHQLMPEVILIILSRNGIDSRTLGLLSQVVEHVSITLPITSSALIQNRLGWLLEISKKVSPFNPIRSVPTQMLFQVGFHSSGLERYLKKFQTKWGKKWKVYDCPLEKIKKSLPWPQNWNA